MAAGGGPGRAERRPAGPVGLVFVAQGGNGRGAPVPEMSGFLKCFQAARTDQGAANAGEILPDAPAGMFRRERVQDGRGRDVGCAFWWLELVE